jgi:elongation factor P
MILASEVKEGSALHIDGKIFKVLEVVRHSGSGQMHGFIELKLKDLRFGHFADHRYKHTDKLDDVELVKRQMEYLYSDTDTHYFMDPETFNQVGVSKTAIGVNDRFFQEGTIATVELLGDEAISILFPKIIEIKIASTSPGRHEGQDNTLKSAILENGIEILVPQFITTGDLVRIDTEKIKYLDRVPVKKV